MVLALRFSSEMVCSDTGVKLDMADERLAGGDHPGWIV